ncbi:MAG: hypothetical protein ACYC7L_10370 [Nitrospirota bacterium]
MMIESILAASRLDRRLASLLEETGEYAQIYLLAKQRKKSCEGTGELMTLKEEFKDTVDKMLGYCRERNHLSGDCEYDIDSFAAAIVKMM